MLPGVGSVWFEDYLAVPILPRDGLASFHSVFEVLIVGATPEGSSGCVAGFFALDVVEAFALWRCLVVLFVRDVPLLMLVTPVFLSFL